MIDLFLVTFLTTKCINCICQKGDEYEEKNKSLDQAGYNVLATGGNHRRFIVECDQFSAPTIDAFSAHLGECVLSL